MRGKTKRKQRQSRRVVPDCDSGKAMGHGPKGRFSRWSPCSLRFLYRNIISQSLFRNGA